MRLTQQERTALSSKRLLEAAIALIAEKGFERTTAAEISELAGYSKPMVTVRFGSKDALLKTLLEAYEDQLVIGVTPDGNGLHRVLWCVDTFQKQARRDPELLRAFFILGFEALGPVPGLKPLLNARIDRFQTILVTAIKDGQADGSIDPGRDAELEVKMLLDLITGPIFRWILNPDIDFPAELEQLRPRIRGWLTTDRS